MLRRFLIYHRAQHILRELTRADLIGKTNYRHPLSREANIPIIYLPGILGVKLHDRQHQFDIWGNWHGTLHQKSSHAPYMLETNQEKHDVVALETLHKFNIIPGLLTSYVTQDLIWLLQYTLNYRVGRDLFFLGHDWRRDYRSTAELLHLEIQRLQYHFGRKQPIIIVAQSMANLAVRYLLRTQPQVCRSIAKWYAFGPPWRGTYNSLKMLQEGYYPAGKKYRGFGVEDIATYPSTFQLLPHQPKLLNSDGEIISDFNIFDANDWQKYHLSHLPNLHIPEVNTYLQQQLNQAQQFQALMNGVDINEENVPQTWFVGIKNQAVIASIYSGEKTLVTEKSLRQYYPQHQHLTLAQGDDHIPLSDFSQNPCGPLIASQDSIPWGENYVLFSKAKTHRELINHTPNLRALVFDLATISKKV